MTKVFLDDKSAAAWLRAFEDSEHQTRSVALVQALADVTAAIERRACIAILVSLLGDWEIDAQRTTNLPAAAKAEGGVLALQQLLKLLEARAISFPISEDQPPFLAS